MRLECGCGHILAMTATSVARALRHRAKFERREQARRWLANNMASMDSFKGNDLAAPQEPQFQRWNVIGLPHKLVQYHPELRHCRNAD
jgi:hypothetical protein